MKTLMAVTISMFLISVCSACRGQDFFRIGLDVEDGEPRYTYFLKPVTQEKLVVGLTRIGKYHPAFGGLLVVPTDRVSASDLLGLLLTIREAGVSNVIVSTSAKRNGVEGRITIAMNMSRDVLYDGGPENVVGFKPKTDEDEFIELAVNPDEKELWIRADEAKEP